MRTIDADALIEKLDAEPEVGYYSPHDVISLLMTQPTIEERKKGKWHKRIYSKVEMMVCSECFNEFSYDAETGVRDYNYCPNCGARMER